LAFLLKPLNTIAAIHLLESTLYGDLPLEGPLFKITCLLHPALWLKWTNGKT